MSQSSPPAGDELLELRRKLLRVVLGTTLKKSGVPPQWIGGEILAMTSTDGEPRIEVRLSVQCDEPRFLTFLSSFQADFQRRLLAIAPDARQWVSGISWVLHTDATFEMALPSADYWAHVMADRELTLRQKGSVEWDRDSLARHFVDTDPGELVVDFTDTAPPDKDVEDIAPARAPAPAPGRKPKR